MRQKRREAIVAYFIAITEHLREKQSSTTIYLLQSSVVSLQ